MKWSRSSVLTVGIMLALVFSMFGLAAVEGVAHAYDFNCPPIPRKVSGDYGDMLSPDEIFDFDQDGPLKLDFETLEKFKRYYKYRYYANEALGNVFKRAYWEMGAWKSRLIEIFREEFEGSGLPEETVDSLMYLAIPESHWRFIAVSVKWAVGPYQFIASTAKLYGLSTGIYATEDRNIDERMDPLMSGRACARYLRDLYDMYGDVDLALSRYNGSYVGRYHDTLKDDEEIDYEGFLAYMNERANMVREDVKRLDLYTYSVRRGESLWSISRKFHVSVKRLATLNKMNIDSRLRRGMHIIIPTENHATKKVVYARRIAGIKENFCFATKFRATIELIEEGFATEEASEIVINEVITVEQVVVEETYTVRRGDTLSRIARRYPGVRAHEIQNHNGIKNPRLLQPGTVLVIPNKKGKSITLESIAREYGDDLDRLKALNPSIVKSNVPLPNGTKVRR